jgi:hypothetical protein
MFSIFGSRSKKLLEQAKSYFEYARDLQGDSREYRAVRVRAAIRCKLVLDKIFIEAAQMEALFREESMIAAAAGEASPKRLEEAAKESTICFQVIKSLNGLVMAYVPQPYAGEMAQLGARFESGLINARQAIELSQKIADRLADELQMDRYLIQPIEPLSFMRERLDELDAMRRDPEEASEEVDKRQNKGAAAKPSPVESAPKKKKESAPESNHSWD